MSCRKNSNIKYLLIIMVAPSMKICYSIGKIPTLKARYKTYTTLRVEISRLLKQVSEAKQHFGRIINTIEDIRRHSITTDLIIDQNVLNTRNRILTSLLHIRCDLAILSDFFVLRQKRQELANQHNWIKLELHPDFSKSRQA